MSHRTILVTTICDTVQRPAKKSLHVPIFVGTRKIMALVDTGASATFIQFSLAKKLGIWDQHTMTREQVRYGNGVLSSRSWELFHWTSRYRRAHSLHPPMCSMGKDQLLSSGFLFWKLKDYWLTVMGDAYYPNRKEEQSRVCHQCCNPVQQLFG